MKSIGPRGRVRAHTHGRFTITASCMLVAATLVIGCSEQDGRVLPDPNPNQNETIAQPTTTTSLPTDQRPMAVSGPWSEGQPIDARYTCDGLNISPLLTWTDPPEGAVSFAVVLTDLDAPGYFHWVVANIPASTTSLGENYSDPLAAVATNSAGKAEYTGPCPPKGSTHSYSLVVYALSQTLEVLTGDATSGMFEAIEAAAIQAASTTFTYSR